MVHYILSFIACVNRRNQSCMQHAQQLGTILTLNMIHKNSVRFNLCKMSDIGNAKLAQQKCDNERCCDVAACELITRDAMTNCALEKVWEPTRAENRRRKQRSVYDRKELVYTKNLAPKLKEKY